MDTDVLIGFGVIFLELFFFLVWIVIRTNRRSPAKRVSEPLEQIPESITSAEPVDVNRRLGIATISISIPGTDAQNTLARVDVLEEHITELQDSQVPPRFLAAQTGDLNEPIESLTKGAVLAESSFNSISDPEFKIKKTLLEMPAQDSAQAFQDKLGISSEDLAEVGLPLIAMPPKPVKDFRNVSMQVLVQFSVAELLVVIKYCVLRNDRDGAKIAANLVNVRGTEKQRAQALEVLGQIP